MVVIELIELLKKYPCDMPIAYGSANAASLLAPGHIKVVTASQPNMNGSIRKVVTRQWAHTYLMFPGD